MSICTILEIEQRRLQELNEFSSLESWDSLAQLQIVLIVEGALGRTLTDLEIGGLNSLNEVLEILGIAH
jgi:acyl carrier protein